MRTFQNYFSGLFIIISFLGIIITLKNIGMTESQYYGIENDKWKTTFGEWITGIFIWGLILHVTSPKNLYNFWNEDLRNKKETET